MEQANEEKKLTSIFGSWFSTHSEIISVLEIAWRFQRLFLPCQNYNSIKTPLAPK